jgi:hypothetical protein
LNRKLSHAPALSCAEINVPRTELREELNDGKNDARHQSGFATKPAVEDEELSLAMARDSGHEIVETE